MLHQCRLGREWKDSVSESADEHFHAWHKLGKFVSVAFVQHIQQQIQAFEIARAGFLIAILSRGNIASLFKQRADENRLLFSRPARGANRTSRDTSGMASGGHISSPCRLAPSPSPPVTIAQYSGCTRCKRSSLKAIWHAHF